MVGRAALSALALLAAGAVAEPLMESVCQPGAAYDPDSPLDTDKNMTCDQTLRMYMGTYLDRRDFTENECMEVISPEDNLTMSMALMYTQMMCCHGAPMGSSGPCGSFFPMGTVCEDPMHFKPGRGTHNFHCEGDEEIEDEWACKRAGDEAWDPDEEEKCDVGRLGLGHSETQMKCEMIGGMWKEHSCMEYHMWLSEQGVIEHPDKVCMNPHAKPAYEMAGGACCYHDDGSAALQRFVECPNTMQDYVCGDPAWMGGTNHFLADELTEDNMTCSDMLAMWFQKDGGRSEFSHEECEAPFGDDQDSNDMPILAQMLLHVQMRCCSEGVGMGGMCGDNFQAGSVCMDPEHFRPSEPLGGWHCNGDEDLDEMECKRAGDGAWDPMSEEKCDLDRLGGEEWEQRARCAMVGGKFEQSKCWMYMPYMSSEGAFDHGTYCASEELQYMFKMVSESCCKDDDWSPAPINYMDCNVGGGGGGGGGQTCTMISRADEMRLTGMGHRLRHC